jgi:DNA-binding transcriptional LysR family regulator
LEKMLEGLSNLRTTGSPRSQPLTVAGQSFLLEAFLPLIAARLPGQQLRGIEVAASYIAATVPEHIFDLAITSGVPRLPADWIAVEVGNLPYGLFASPTLARPFKQGRLSVTQARSLPFITPAVFFNGQLVPGDDRCPLHLTERRVEYQVPTISTALALASRVDCAVFGPALVARPYLESKKLIELRVPDWNVDDKISVICAADRVRSKTLSAIAAEVSAALESSRKV